MAIWNTQSCHLGLLLLLLGFCLGFSDLASAQQIGTLAGCKPDAASFLVDGQSVFLTLQKGQGQTLGKAGLGSLWEIYHQEGKLTSALPRGTDRQVLAALDALEKFLVPLERRQWRQAYEQLCHQEKQKIDLGGFERRWSQRVVSLEERDWLILSVSESEIEVQIRGLRMEAEDFVPDHFITTFGLHRHGNSWCLGVKGYRDL